MSTLTKSFSAASFQIKPIDSFLEWFLIFMFLDITDSREEKSIERKKRHVFQEEFQRKTALHQKREIRRIAMTL